MRASLLRVDPYYAQPKICLDRLSSDSLNLSSLALFMDCDHLEEVEVDWSDWGSEVDSPPPPMLKKTTFHPNLSLMHILNPRHLVIQGPSSKGQKKRTILPFFVETTTAHIISNWPRLRLVRLQGALLHASTNGSSESARHRIVPLPKSRTSTDLSPVVIQIHLASLNGALRTVSGAYENDQDLPLDCNLLTYLSNSIGKRFSSPIHLCYIDKAARTLLEGEKEKWGDSWPNQFQICSSKEAKAAAKLFLDK